MSKRLHSKTHTFNQQALELMIATPVVVAHRLTRMLTAGATPSARDKTEFARMGAEKNDAFVESWTAIGNTMLKSNQRMAHSMFQAWFNPQTYFTLASGKIPSAFAPSWSRVSGDAIDVSLNALAPVHRRAVSNAKRLTSGR